MDPSDFQTKRLKLTRTTQSSSAVSHLMIVRLQLRSLETPGRAIKLRRITATCRPMTENWPTASTHDTQEDNPTASTHSTRRMSQRGGTKDDASHATKHFPLLYSHNTGTNRLMKPIIMNSKHWLVHLFGWCQPIILRLYLTLLHIE